MWAAGKAADAVFNEERRMKRERGNRKREREPVGGKTEYVRRMGPYICSHFADGASKIVFTNIITTEDKAFTNPCKGTYTCMKKNEFIYIDSQCFQKRVCNTITKMLN